MIHRWSIARRLFVANLLIRAGVHRQSWAPPPSSTPGTAAYDEAGRRMAGVAAVHRGQSPGAAGGGHPGSVGRRCSPMPWTSWPDADADFITIMAPDRTRWTHPRDEELGKPYIGSIDAALARRNVHRGHGRNAWARPCAPSLRSRMPAGSVKALVAAGVTVRTVDVAVSGRLPALLAIGLALLVGGSWPPGCWAATCAGSPGAGGRSSSPSCSPTTSPSSIPSAKGVILIDTQGQGGDVQRPGRRTAGA